MGYGLGSRLSALGALAPWRRGGAVCLCFGSCVYEARGADATRAVCANTVEAYGPTKERDARHTIALSSCLFGFFCPFYKLLVEACTVLRASWYTVIRIRDSRCTHTGVRAGSAGFRGGKVKESLMPFVLKTPVAK